MCQALEGCQVSCVPDLESGLVCLMEGALELIQVKCTILKMARLSPDMGRRESNVPYLGGKTPYRIPVCRTNLASPSFRDAQDIQMSTS